MNPNKPCSKFLLWLLPFFFPSVLNASSNIRYALVVGNNQGYSAQINLKTLKHAEEEAVRLRQTLIQYGNFDPERVLLVKGQGRAEILSAARKLTQLHKQDQNLLGALPTLFAFFFTGHGLDGKLLTRDQPISGRDVGSIFSQMNASLSIGFFDACFSESIALDELQAKGAISTPGFNPFTELPKEILRAKGSIWFVSSRPHEQSYEHKRKGGLFTHYFLESFKKAAPDGIAITLEQMWEYARRHTEAQASAYGKKQTPVKIVHSLKAHGPLYFSFPHARNASIVFDATTSGTFLLQYKNGSLLETIQKTKGQSKEIAVFSGEISLSHIKEKTKRQIPSSSLVVAPGARIHVRTKNLPPSSKKTLGYTEIPMESKGELSDFVLSKDNRHFHTALQIGYGFSPLSQETLQGRHRIGLGTSLFYGPFSLSLDAFYAWESKNFSDWGYRLNEWIVRAFLGYGFPFSTLRVNVELGGEPGFLTIRYSDGFEKDHVSLWLGSATRLVWQYRSLFFAQARLGIGALHTVSVAFQDRDPYWSFAPLFELGLGIPF